MRQKQLPPNPSLEHLKSQVFVGWLEQVLEICYYKLIGFGKGFPHKLVEMQRNPTLFL